MNIFDSIGVCSSMTHDGRSQSTRWGVERAGNGRNHIDEGKGKNMIIPIRCFSCGAVIADRWDEYLRLIDEGKSSEEAMDTIGLERYCCRRMYVSHVELMDDISPFTTSLNS